MENPTVNRYGTLEWKKRGQLHRDDGPAAIYYDGEEWWYQNGLLHREFGPAVEYPDGQVEWWVLDEPYNFDEYCKIQGISDKDAMFLKLKYGEGEVVWRV